MGDILFIPAIEIGNPGSGPGPGTHCPAISGQPADPGFGMQCCQIGNEESPHEGVMIRL